jgi:hypothetical protein
LGISSPSALTAATAGAAGAVYAMTGAPCGSTSAVVRIADSKHLRANVHLFMIVCPFPKQTKQIAGLITSGRLRISRKKAVSYPILS